MKIRLWQKWLVGVIVVIVAFCLATPWPSQVLALPLTVDETPKNSDVIIILGAGTRLGPDPIPQQAKDRVSKGMLLWQQGFAQRAIVSGGVGPKTGITEAVIMKQFATAIGGDPTEVYQELESHDTYENIVNSLAMMKRNDWNSALLVTSSYHTWRACRLAREQKANVRCIAAPLTEGTGRAGNRFYERMVNLRAVVREYAAILLFYARGKL